MLALADAAGAASAAASAGSTSETVSDREKEREGMGGGRNGLTWRRRNVPVRANLARCGATSVPHPRGASGADFLFDAILASKLADCVLWRRP